jgi:DtxR family transcriptional regulator, Mn-dependent transcriptional regulator
MSLQTSPAAQDYLKALYLEAEPLERVGGTSPMVPMSAVAQRLGVSAASATNMLKRLAEAGMVEHSPYKGARLSPRGRAAALEVIRHHRLLETFLSTTLGVPWDRVHAEAEVLEHFLSEDLEERIAVSLGDPTTDPHGHPIPTRELEVSSSSDRALWDLPENLAARVVRVSDEQPEILRYLTEIGIAPGVTIQVTKRGPLGEPIFLRVDNRDDGSVALSREVAERIWVA